MINDVETAAWQRIGMRSLTEMPMVLGRILDELEDLGFTEKEIFGVRLALEEALVNAVKHGHRGDSTKMVRVRYHASLLQFTVQIEDEGRGFNPEKVPDPLEPANLQRPGGRGVLLMGYYMTWVEYNEIGNCVTMCKLRT
ncbi:MAG: ATP-binding protein [Planctomycetes bacterium]|nr:ATP-binding protein [Planctomycetota bacterium]